MTLLLILHDREAAAVVGAEALITALGVNSLSLTACPPGGLALTAYAPGALSLTECPPGTLFLTALGAVPPTTLLWLYQCGTELVVGTDYETSTTAPP